MHPAAPATPLDFTGTKFSTYILLYLQTRIKKNKYKHEKKKKKSTSVMEKKCTKKCREKP